MAPATRDDRELSLAEAGGGQFEAVVPGERYRFRVPGLLLQLECDRLRWERGELYGQFDVRLALQNVPSVDGLTETSTLNFSRLDARSKRATDLSRLSRTPQYPWYELVQTFCLLVLKAEREGDPPVNLRDVLVDPTGGLSETVLGIPIPRHDPMMITAKSGEGKSLLVLRIMGELSRRGFRVAYLDSEWNEFVHADRLSKLFGPERPSVPYLRLHRPLTVEADRVRRFLLDVKADFLALDSVGLSTDGSMEYSEAPLAFYRALRGFGRLGSVLVSHTKHEAVDGSNKRPYGSQFWLVGCRAAWHLKSADAGPGRLEGVLEQIKVNAGSRHVAPIGLRFEFGAGITIEAIAPGDLTELSDSLPIRDRIIATLKRRGALSLDELVDDLEAKRESVKKAINRDLQKVFTKVATIGSDTDVVKFGLLDRRAS